MVSGRRNVEKQTIYKIIGGVLIAVPVSIIGYFGYKKFASKGTATVSTPPPRPLVKSTPATKSKSQQKKKQSPPRRPMSPTKAMKQKKLSGLGSIGWNPFSKKKSSPPEPSWPGKLSVNDKPVFVGKIYARDTVFSPQYGKMYGKNDFPMMINFSNTSDALSKFNELKNNGQATQWGIKENSTWGTMPGVAKSRYEMYYRNGPMI